MDYFLVPEIARGLSVGVEINRRGEVRAGGGEGGGEPGEGVAVGGRGVDAAVEVDDGGDAGARGGGGDGGVPREEVAGREVVGPGDVGGDTPEGLDGGAGDRGSFSGRAVGENPGGREITMKFLPRLKN